MNTTTGFAVFTIGRWNLESEKQKPIERKSIEPEAGTVDLINTIV